MHCSSSMNTMSFCSAVGMPRSVSSSSYEMAIGKFGAAPLREMSLTSVLSSSDSTTSCCYVEESQLDVIRIAAISRTLSSQSYKMAINQQSSSLPKKQIGERILCSLVCPIDQVAFRAAPGSDQHETYEKMMLDALERMKAKKQHKKMEQLQKKIENILQLPSAEPLHKAPLEEFESQSEAFARNITIQMAALHESSLPKYIEVVGRFCSAITDSQKKGGLKRFVGSFLSRQ